MPTATLAGDLEDYSIGSDSNGSVTATMLGNTTSLAGFDEIRFDGNVVYKIVRGLPGQGGETLGGTAQREIIVGFDGPDTFLGSLENDLIIGALTADSGVPAGPSSAFGRISYDVLGAIQGVFVSLANGTATDSFGGFDKLIGIKDVTGTKFNDIFLGDNNDNVFRSLGTSPQGVDSVDGAGGSDTAVFSGRIVDYRIVEGSVGDVVIVDQRPGASDGLDSLFNVETASFSDGNLNLVVGTAGDDPSITGTADRDALFGFRGNDVLTGGAADDVLDGGAGNDTAVYSGARGDYAITGTGDGGLSIKDLRSGLPDGTDRVTNIETLRFGLTDIAVSALTITITGTSGDDTLRGTVGNDVILGLAGEDIFEGGAGEDIFYGNTKDANGPINDPADVGNGVWYNNERGGSGVVASLLTGTATDTYGDHDTFFGMRDLVGSIYGDTLTGDNNTNLFRSFSGDDTIDGQGGTDEILYHLDTGLTAGIEVRLADGLGSGTVKKTYAAGIQEDHVVSIEDVRGTRFVDDIVGNDVRNRLRGLGGADILDGAGGRDVVDYQRDADFGGTAGILADLAAGTVRDGGGDIDLVTNIEDVYGSRYADTIKGDGGENLLRGLGGDDILDGRGGTDIASYLGARNDYQITRLASGELTVRDLRLGSPDGTDTLTNMETLRFANGDVAASLFDPPSSGPTTPPAPPSVTPTPEVVTIAIDTVLPGISTPGLTALQDKLARGEITFEQLVDGLVVEAQSSTVPSLIVANLIGGETPTKEHLAELTVFAQAQFDAYAEKGVANPALGSYEALGLGFSETVSFQTKYAALPPDIFLVDAYQNVFGRGATAEQQEHFNAQLSYFQNLYRGAGFTAPEALLKAKGAIVGQMMGHAVLDEPALHNYDDAANGFLRTAVTGQGAYGEPLALV